MPKILVFGSGPLPGAADQIANAGGLRTAQFLHGLEGCGEITLALITTAKQIDPPSSGAIEAGEKGPSLFEFSRSDPQLFVKARALARKEQFDFVIGVNTFPAFVAAKSIRPETPFWADLNGWIMAEMQAQAAEVGHNDYLAHGWGQEYCILKRADQISTVSTAQRFAVMGEAASLGKLKKETFAIDFLHVIPNAPQHEKNDNFDTAVAPLLKGNAIPKESFLISQIGGFNNWVDEQTLFFALEEAMRADSRLHFATTGGKIDHIAADPFSRFQERIANSPFHDRFHLLGWVQKSAIDRLFSESDLGIMVDRLCAETETGARNRLNEMMVRGLPLLTTRGSEISIDIARWECGEVVESGNAGALAKSILALKADPEKRSRFTHRAQEICATILTPVRTLAPVRAWLESSESKNLHQFRSDFKVGRIRSKIKAGIRLWRERGFGGFWQKARQYLHR